MSLDLEEEPLPSAAEPECKVWTEGGFNPGHLCTVTDDVVAVHDGTNVTFVFLKTGERRILIVAEFFRSCTEDMNWKALDQNLNVLS